MEPLAIAARDIREALGCFATGVTIVTASGDHVPVGITANSFNSVSLDPPLVLVSLDRRLHSFPRFSASRYFAVNILATHQRGLSQRFASAGADKWSAVPYSLGRRTGCPVIEGAHATFECERWNQHDGGDHVIFIGRILHLNINDGHEPLLYYRGKYRALGADA